MSRDDWVPCLYHGANDTSCEKPGLPTSRARGQRGSQELWLNPTCLGTSFPCHRWPRVPVWKHGHGCRVHTGQPWKQRAHLPLLLTLSPPGSGTKANQKRLCPPSAKVQVALWLQVLRGPGSFLLAALPSPGQGLRPHGEDGSLVLTAISQTAGWQR